MSDRHVIFYDKSRMKVGCVLLQAAMGGDKDLVARYFSAETWLDFLTAELKPYTVTIAEAKRIAAMSSAA